jgi:hypothetical protein
VKHVRNKVNTHLYARHTGGAVDNVIAEGTKWTTDVCSPAHVVAVDHTLRSVVIAVRGSLHVRDALTDVLLTLTPLHDDDDCDNKGDNDCNGGDKLYAHGGILAAARSTLANVETSLKIAAAEYPRYDVVIVGHSLGAGTAALLFRLLKRRLPLLAPRLRCVTYGCPPILTTATGSRLDNESDGEHTRVVGSDVIASEHTYVVGADIISSMSHANLAAFYQSTDADAMNASTDANENAKEAQRLHLPTSSVINIAPSASVSSSSSHQLASLLPASSVDASLDKSLRRFVAASLHHLPATYERSLAAAATAAAANDAAKS